MLLYFNLIVLIKVVNKKREMIKEEIKTKVKRIRLLYIIFI